jgi:DNA polymerase-3 subunit epsilon
MARYIIFDLETTGLHRINDRIVSIAAYDLRTDEVFYEEVNPLRPCPVAASKVHGLTDDVLRKKPIWAVVGPRFWRWVLERQPHGAPLCLVGHNAKAFDVPVLSNELARLSDLPPARGPLYVVDTLLICREIFPKEILASKNQPAVYRHLFQEDPGDQHNALGDVTALARIAREPVLRRRLETPAIAFRYELGGKNMACWPANLLALPETDPTAPPATTPTQPQAAPSVRLQTIVTSPYFKSTPYVSDKLDKDV